MHDNNKHSDLRSFHRFAWMRFWGNSPALNLLADDPQASVSVEISGKQVASSTHNKDPSSGESIVRFEEDNQQEVMVWTCGFLWQIAIPDTSLDIRGDISIIPNPEKQFKKKNRTEHLDVEFLEIQVDIFHTILKAALLLGYSPPTTPRQQELSPQTHEILPAISAIHFELQV